MGKMLMFTKEKIVCSKSEPLKPLDQINISNFIKQSKILQFKESRIGKKPIILPTGVKVTSCGNNIKATGPKGDLELDLDQSISVSIENDNVKVIRKEDGRRARQLHGLSRTLLNNMLIGVSS